MQLEIKKHLFDIKTSIDSINEYLGADRNFNDYQGNKLLRRAIERELEIIGEAAGKILKIDPTINIENARNCGLRIVNCGYNLQFTIYHLLFTGLKHENCNYWYRICRIGYGNLFR